MCVCVCVCVTTLSSAPGGQHVGFEVSLVDDVSGWGVAGHDKRGAVRRHRLPHTQLTGALPHHRCEVTWGGEERERMREMERDGDEEREKEMKREREMERK